MGDSIDKSCSIVTVYTHTVCSIENMCMVYMYIHVVTVVIKLYFEDLFVKVVGCSWCVHLQWCTGYYQVKKT